MKKLPVIVNYDCKTCGACCVAYPGMDSWADVSREDIAAMGRTARRQVVSTEESTLYTDCNSAIATVGAPPRCVFLRGTVGSRVSCRIYETRPRVCSDFEPGSSFCQQFRLRNLP